jgi:Spy/CpxP family protein refolding chaperone
MKMAGTYFITGFVSALVLAMLIMATTYAYLKQTRGKPKNIVGYLDLIPDLTEAQRNQVQEIRKVFLPKVDNIRQSLYMKRAELADLLFIEPTDREKIYAVAEQILHHQSELENEVIEHILEERELLSPSQKRKFYEVIVQQFAAGGLGVHDVEGRRS